jgi:hypothetical protein
MEKVRWRPKTAGTVTEGGGHAVESFWASSPYPNFVYSYPYIGRRRQNMCDHLFFFIGDQFFCWSNTSYPSYLKKLLVALLLILRYIC